MSSYAAYKAPMGSRVKAVENQCPICGLAYDFKTDDIGRLVAIHSVVKCRPRPVATTPSIPDSYCDYETRCGECHKLFRPKRRAGKAQVVCGDVCRRARQHRLKRESEAKRGRWWKARNITRRKVA